MGFHANLLTLQEVETILHDVLVKEHLIGADIEVDSGAGKGDGYLSSINKIKVSGNGKILHLIIKTAPVSKEFRQMVPINDLYSRENYFYDTVYPIFKKFQMSKNIKNPFEAVAHCYLTESKEFNERLVLENIKDGRGFEMWNKRDQLDDTHITAIFKLYGKLHGTSFAFLDQNPEEFNSLTKDMADLMGRFSSNFFDQLKEPLRQYKAIFEKCEKDQLDGLDRAIADVKPFLKKVETQPAKYSVINHGDCWSNNMMFKYEEGTKNIIDIKLLDFQLMRRCSPVMDLSYFLYAGGKKEVYNNLSYYLNIYYNSLSNHMKQLGSDPQKMYPYSALKNDWKEYSRFGFIMAASLIKAVLLDKDEVVDFTDLSPDTDPATLVPSMKAEKLANTRFRNLVEHFIKNQFI